MQEPQETQVWSLDWEDQSLGGGNGNPLQYSCLENPMDWVRSLAGCGPWGHEESNRLNQLACTYHLLPNLPSGLILSFAFPFILIATKNPSLPDHCHLFPYLCLTLVYLWCVLNSRLSMISQFLSLCSLELPVHNHQDFLYPQTLLWWFISSFFSHRNLAFPEDYCFFCSPHKKWNYYLSHPVYLGTNKWSWCLPCLLLIFMDDCNFCL